MFFSLAHITDWLLHYRYLVLFPLVMAEGPIVTVFAGSLASIKMLNFFVAYAVIVFGDLAGDSFYYALGRFGRHSFLNKWGRYIGINENRIKNLEKHFTEYGGRTLILGKLTHAVGSVVLVAAGIVKVPYSKFIWFNLIATLIKSLALLLLGYYFAQAYLVVAKYSNYVTATMLALIILAIIVYVFTVKMKAKKSKNENSNL